MSDQITISKEEAKAIVMVMKGSWVPIDKQKVIYELIERLEKEIEA